MIVQIKKDSEGTEEWAIIELQGDLESRSSKSLNEQFIGDLHFTKTGVPILIIGHHILYGKESKLERPFAVLEKESNENSSEDNPSRDYIVKAIIKKKLAFRVRPKPIIANVPKVI